MGDGTPDGLLVIDKPAGWTSHDVVARMRRLLGTRRVGHAGTLDPMATGVLVIGVGRGTRLLTFLLGSDKTYLATIRLGLATVTDDADGDITRRATPAAIGGLTDAGVAAAVARLTGEIRQVPSSVSAVKVAGVRSYARVRAGQEVRLAERPVEVHRFAVLRRARLDLPDGPVWDLDVDVHVSSGTYVRALARDLGTALGVGGHLTALRRTRVGTFDVSQAHDLASWPAEPVDGIPVLPLAEAARFWLPSRDLDEEQARAVGHGRRVLAVGSQAQAVAAFGPDGRLVAVLDQSSPVAAPLVVFQPGGSA